MYPVVSEQSISLSNDRRRTDDERQSWKGTCACTIDALHGRTADKNQGWPSAKKEAKNCMLKDGRTILYGGGQLAQLSATDTVEGKETRRGVKRTRNERPREPRVVSSKFHLSIGGVVMNVAVNELRRCERAEKRSRGPLSDAGKTQAI